MNCNISKAQSPPSNIPRCSRPIYDQTSPIKVSLLTVAVISLDQVNTVSCPAKPLFTLLFRLLSSPSFQLTTSGPFLELPPGDKRIRRTKTPKQDFRLCSVYCYLSLVLAALQYCVLSSISHQNRQVAFQVSSSRQTSQQSPRPFEARDFSIMSGLLQNLLSVVHSSELYPVTNTSCFDLQFMV